VGPSLYLARVWGLPEAYLPNVRESDQAFRPIDLLAFPESPDPTDAVEAPDLNEAIGVEAKGESSFGGDRMIRQLSEFHQTKTLSLGSILQFLNPSKRRV